MASRQTVEEIHRNLQRLIFDSDSGIEGAFIKLDEQPEDIYLSMLFQVVHKQNKATGKTFSIFC